VALVVVDVLQLRGQLIVKCLERDVKKKKYRIFLASFFVLSSVTEKIMKKSNYNVFVNRPNLTICYNTLTNTIIAVNNHIYDKFINLESAEFKKVYPKHYDVFIKGGFLVSKERNKLDEIRLSHKIAAFRDVRKCQIMIYPTQDCNLNCWYCYEYHVYGSKMNKDIQERIIKYLGSKIINKEIDSLNLAYFGGEPLMYFNKIAFPISYRLKQMCIQNNIKFSTFFVTNGSLISEKIIENLKLINPYFQITIDGNKDKHDKVRVGKNNNSPSYDKIIKALTLISENISSGFDNEIRIITLRINYDNETLKDIDSLIEDIRCLNQNKVVIHLERVWQTKGQKDEEQSSLLNNAIRKLSLAGFHVGWGLFGIKSYSCPAEKYDYAMALLQR
jgi:uncharacterized protein